MPETEPIRPEVPQLEDKRFKIPGILPKNTQHRLLLALAVLMVVILALSGKNPPKEHTAAALANMTAAVDPNQLRIQEYRARIEEQARKLALEEARLAQTQRTMGLSSSPQGPGGIAPVEAGSPRAVTAPYPSYLYDAARVAPEQDTHKRESRALFASN